MTFADKLKELDACTEAREWVANKTLTQAWKLCKRGDWMLWLAFKNGVDGRLVVEAACRCAEATLGFISEGEKRPIQAIATARAWITGAATLEDVRDAANAAAYAAANAANAAAYAAANAANAATYAANAAAYAAAYAAYTARAEALSDCADLVRQVITVRDFP